MTATAMSREWFTTYCQNAAANVLDKDGKVRFTYEQLKSGLDSVGENVSNGITDLHEKIVQLCNNKCQHAEGANQSALILTLLNIHAAYLMVSGLWKEEPQPDKDYCGFEIF